MAAEEGGWLPFILLSVKFDMDVLRRLTSGAFTTELSRRSLGGFIWLLECLSLWLVIELLTTLNGPKLSCPLSVGLAATLLVFLSSTTVSSGALATPVLSSVVQLLLR